MGWMWKLLRAGSLRLDGGGMFGVVPKSLWSRMAEPDANNRIPLQTNCVLLERDDHRVLIETGFGDKWSDKERGFYDLEHRTVVDALAEVGVAPETITHVIVSHLHFDHAAGLTRHDGDGNAVPAFPNAEIIVQQREWDDALANRSTMTRTYLPTHLEPIADRVRTVDGKTDALPGITVWPVPGHTWGQHAIRFDDADGTVVFAGDVMPTRNHVHAAFSMGYDMEPYTSMQSKLKLLDAAEARSWRLVLDHEPGDAVVRVERDGDRPDRFQLVTA